MNFHEHIQFQCRIWPEKPAILLADRIVTYGMLGQGIRGVVRSLTAAGIRRGDIVGVLVDSPTWNLILSCALAHVGAVGASVGTVETAEALDVPFAALIAQTDLSKRTRHRVVVMTERWFDLAPETRPVRWAEAGETIRITLSSGTTGVPKPLAFDARALRARMETRNVSAGYAGTERVLIMVGLSTSLGLLYALDTLASGRTLCFAPDSAEAARMIALFHIDGVIASTRAAELLVEDQRRRPVPLTSLRMFIFGGGLHAPDLAEAVMARICPSAVSIYGSAEMGAIAWAPLDRLRVPGAVGYVGSTAEVEIVDDADRPVPPGTEGHVRVRSPAAAKPFGEADRAACGFDADGWHHPGDLGRLDPGGLLIVTGRADHLINSGGIKSAPERIEREFAGAPGIRDVAVVAVPRSDGPPAIVALVVPTADYAPSALADWAARHVRLARIDRFVRADAIPRNAMGKIDRAHVKTAAAAALM